MGASNSREFHLKSREKKIEKSEDLLRNCLDVLGKAEVTVLWPRRAERRGTEPTSFGRQVMATKKTTQPAAVHGQPAITEAALEPPGTDTTVAKAAEVETSGAEVHGNHQRTIPFKGKRAAKPRSQKQGKARSAANQAETMIPKSQKPAPKAKKAEFHDNKLSALDAAAKVLQEAGQPMNCQEMIAAMAAKGYWSSPAGQTPASTLYSALSREIKIKGNQARFQKTARGQFAYQSPKAS